MERHLTTLYMTTAREIDDEQPQEGSIVAVQPSVSGLLTLAFDG